MLGNVALLALVEAHGGTRLYVRATVVGQHPLDVLLGEQAAKRFVREFGRDTLCVPLCKKWRAVMLRSQGLSYAAIARRLGMHEMAVYRLLKSVKGDGGVPVGPPTNPTLRARHLAVLRHGE